MVLLSQEALRFPMAKSLFETSPDLEFFTQLEADKILRVGKSTRLNLIRAGKLTVINVGGNRLVTGSSLRGYIADCVANPQPTGRSLGAKRTNSRKVVVR
jgi:hypothetical protein